MLQALIAYRCLAGGKPCLHLLVPAARPTAYQSGLFLFLFFFFKSVGIGAEYPAGSVACSENTEEEGIPKGSQHFLFAISTNSMIDVGFVVATLVPFVLLYICGEDHLRAVWRLSFGLGVVFPIILLFFRTKMVESTRFVKSSMVRGPTPYKLIIKRYWKSFLGLSVAWFIYDFISYPFGIYSSTIVDIITGGASDLKTVFKWNIIINGTRLPETMSSHPTP